MKFLRLSFVFLLYFCTLDLYCILVTLYVGVDDAQPITGSLTGTKLESLYGNVGQDGLFTFSYTLIVN